MRSAATPLAFGMVLKMRMRSFPPSATNRRFPSESTKRGKLSVAAQRVGKRAVLALSVPVVWQSTGDTPVGFPAVLSVALVILKLLFSVDETRSGWPIATSAAVPLAVGTVFQIRTRFWPKSATKSRTPSELTATGVCMLLAAVVGCFEVRSGWTNAVNEA